MTIADFEIFEPSPGFRVYVHPTRKFKATTISLYVHQPLGEECTRLALLPFILRRGCRGFPNLRVMVRFLEDLYGASMGADVAKVGDRQLLSFRFEGVNDRFAPKKVHALEKAIDFLWRLLAFPTAKEGALNPAYVSQEKENLKRLIEGMINERMAYAHERCVQEMFAGKPFSRSEYGRIEEIGAATGKRLHALHERVLATAPVELFVVGDVSPSRVADMAGRAFRFRGRKPAALPPTEVEPPGANGMREIVERLDVEQGKLVLGCRTGVSWGRRDAFPMVLYNGLLGAFPHSKLFVNVREREGLAYATHSSLDLTKGLLFISAGIDPGKYAPCVEVIKKQMGDLAEGRVSLDEWEKTRRTLVDKIRSREDNPSAKIAAFFEMNLNGKPMMAEEIVAGLSGVTPEDVKRVASSVRLDTAFFLTRP